MAETREAISTIDRFGRVLIPKPMRDGLGLAAGEEIVLRQVGATLEIEPAKREPTLVVKEGVLVYGGRATGDLDGVLRAERDHRLARLAADKK